MKKKSFRKEIPYRNRTPVGWWVASYLERFEWKADGPPKPNHRCLAYENTILIRAKDRGAAYKKVLGIKKSYSKKWRNHGDPPGRPARWVFEGPTSLLAVHEKLEDGAEIIWRIHSQKLIRTVRSYVKAKRQLETFIDN